MTWKFLKEKMMVLQFVFKMGNETMLNNLLWDGLEIWDVAVCVENFWTLVTTHQLSAIHTHCTPVFIGIIFLCLPSTLSMFWKTN
jgi:hypothetical protein